MDLGYVRKTGPDFNILKEAVINISDIKSTKDLVKFWIEKLSQLSEKPEQEVAYSLVSVVSHPLWESIYHAESPDLDLVAIFDLASQLEIPGGSEESRRKNWEELKRHMSSLESRYMA